MATDLKDIVDTASGRRPADLLLRGGKVVNVFTGEVGEAHVALCGEVIAGVGRQYGAGLRELDVTGATLIPGLIDAHVHLESALLTPGEFARAAVPRGTAAVVADPERDLLKLAVIERHHATGSVGVGLVRGFGLKRGALASTVAHDSHNVIVVGAGDEDMLCAVEELARIGGGLTVAAGGQALASLALPVAGLMSPRPANEVAAAVAGLREAASGLGCEPESPFAVLSFLALPVIPELRLTDRGLVDVAAMKHVPLVA